MQGDESLKRMNQSHLEFKDKDLFLLQGPLKSITEPDIESVESKQKDDPP